MLLMTVAIRLNYRSEQDFSQQMAGMRHLGIHSWAQPSLGRNGKSTKLSVLHSDWMQWQRRRCVSLSTSHEPMLHTSTITFVGNNWIKISPTLWFTKVKMFPSAVAYLSIYLTHLSMLMSRVALFSWVTASCTLRVYLTKGSFINSNSTLQYLHNFEL